MAGVVHNGQRYPCFFNFLFAELLKKSLEKVLKFALTAKQGGDGYHFFRVFG